MVAGTQLQFVSHAPDELRRELQKDPSDQLLERLLTDPEMDTAWQWLQTAGMGQAGYDSADSVYIEVRKINKQWNPSLGKDFKKTQTAVKDIRQKCAELIKLIHESNMDIDADTVVNYAHLVRQKAHLSPVSVLNVRTAGPVNVSTVLEVYSRMLEDNPNDPLRIHINDPGVKNANAGQKFHVVRLADYFKRAFVRVDNSAIASFVNAALNLDCSLDANKVGILLKK